jgi:uncharacterized membrane protein YcaP (DUF421 family)
MFVIYEGWYGVVRILVIGPLAYGALILLLRISGKRTLAKLNVFDLIVTVALGSTLATILLSKTVPLAEGLTSLVLLVLLQYCAAWLSGRLAKFSDLVKSEPTLLLRNGVILEGAVRRRRITHKEILAALRGAGASVPGDATAVILETDGSLSVTKSGASGGSLAL